FLPPHLSLAQGTAGHIDPGDPRKRLLPGFGRCRVRLLYSEQGAAGLETRLSVPVAQQTEVAYLHEPVGKDVEEEPPDELGGIEGHDLLSVPVGIVLPEEGDQPVLHADDAVVR